MFVCLPDELILGFCYSDLTLETGGFELASTITLVLQANRLTQNHRITESYAYHRNAQKIIRKVTRDRFSFPMLLKATKNYAAIRKTRT